MTAPLSARLRVFLSYYRPYRRILILDLLCALVVSGVALVIPLCAGYVTRTVLNLPAPQATAELMRVGAFMLGLVALHIACNTIVD